MNTAIRFVLDAFGIILGLSTLALAIGSRKPSDALRWAGVQAASWLVLFPIGVVLLLPLSLLRLWHTAPSLEYNYDVTVWNGGKLTWLWGNEEDGVLPSDRNHYLVGKPDWLRAYLWSAWRNSTNNVRFAASIKGGAWLQVRRWGWYFQAGYRPDTGWPVWSAGAGLGTQV